MVHRISYNRQNVRHTRLACSGAVVATNRTDYKIQRIPLTLTNNMRAQLPELRDFLSEHRLPPRYAELAGRWFLPLADALALQRQQVQHPLLIGINGSQGSGKSTLAALLRELFRTRHGLSAIDLSIDDFYLPRAQRQRLASEIHPLLATRGVPGTHDIPLMQQTLQALTRGNQSVPIPRFDKASDDRVPERDWQHADSPLDMVIIEGWCLGTPAQDEAALQQPVNVLEANEDPDARWRHYVNNQIIEHYQPLYEQIDIWAMLKAPSFDCVYQWRLEQEQKLADRLGTEQDDKRIMSPAEIARFIEHYQRLTMHTLSSLPSQVHYLYELDSERNICAAGQPRRITLS